MIKMKKNVVLIGVCLLAAVALLRPSGVHVQADSNDEGAAPVGYITDARIKNHDKEPGNWLSYGRTYAENRFSPLTQINQETVADLGLAWYLDMGTNRAQEATPIVVDGIMYFTSTWSRVHAVRAATGEPVWDYDPEVPGAWARRLCCDVVNRGVSVYQGKVYVGTLDGRLIALDAATGEPVWEIDTLIDRTRFYSITGAPRAANGKIFIGNGGAEFGVRGYVSAFDAETGELVWRFFTVPGDPSKPFEHPELEAAAKTWKGDEWWKIGGGGTVWNSIVYDPELNSLYIGVGNGSPWTRTIRSPGGGDNLFLSSIVALDADTGRMKWYYQTTPGDSWDFTATQDIALATLDVDGRSRKVLLQAPKNGFFYVLDRENGELLRAHPYGPVTWASHVDMKTGRPVENPEARYEKKASWVMPGPAGGHNWQAMAFDKEAGLAFIPAQESPMVFEMADEWKDGAEYKRNPGRWNNGLELGRLTQIFLENAETAPPMQGFLKAFDPLTGEVRWSVKHDYYWNGGVLATAGGLVFQGDAMGKVSAYNKDTGELLWAFDTHTSILAPPITFAIDGVQYVSILTGTGGADLFGGEVPTVSGKYGNYGKMLTFALGRNEELPEPTILDKSIPPVDFAGAPDIEIAAGERLYNNFCAACHGLFAKSGGAIPDLRLLGEGKHGIFSEIVLDGVLEASGMASFSDVLTEKEVESIQLYLKARAHEDREAALGHDPNARLTWQDPN